MLRTKQASSVPAQRHVMCFMGFSSNLSSVLFERPPFRGTPYATEAWGPRRVEYVSSIRHFPGVASVREFFVNTND